MGLFENNEDRTELNYKDIQLLIYNVADLQRINNDFARQLDMCNSRISDLERLVHTQSMDIDRLEQRVSQAEQRSNNRW